MPASCTTIGLPFCFLCVLLDLQDSNPSRSAFEIMKSVYEIRLKMSGAESADLLEAEVACFDSAVMIVLGSASTATDLEYTAKVCSWMSDAIRQALQACNKPSAAGRGAPSKKAKEPLQQRKAFLERAQLRLWSLKPELDPTWKKNKNPYARLCNSWLTSLSRAPQECAIIRAILSPAAHVPLLSAAAASHHQHVHVAFRPRATRQEVLAECHAELSA
jgi:hypothetical protein